MNLREDNPCECGEIEILENKPPQSVGSATTDGTRQSAASSLNNLAFKTSKLQQK